MATYAELCTLVQDTTENTFEANQLASFADQVEQQVYQAVQIPALRKNVTGSLTATNQYLAIPSDFLYVYSMAVMLPTGEYRYLLDKDVNFIREAYPFPLVDGVPKNYAIFDASSFILGPTPDAAYDVELHYGYYPESIVTAGTTWLSEKFSPVLLNGMLMQAARFMKSEQDIIALYDKMYGESLQQLKQLGDAKLRQDTYRSGQTRNKVN